ncbi:venom protein I-like protein precursor [Nasonia vitripennis]|uniref:Uncharacterized protein n=1 Tax=Nasonia vitripennis TaxID=7425 RepID=A0A7M6UG20_NASVI|nr:venom protein I-like protein precursor [Nasonia vitripennis]
MKFLIPLLILGLATQINCHLLADCEDRSWYCKDSNRAARCQKMDECFPPTTPDDSVQQNPCTSNPFDDLKEFFFGRWDL